jgi:hypothetical protein
VTSPWECSPLHGGAKSHCRRIFCRNVTSALPRPIRVRLCARPFLMREALLEKIAGLHAHGLNFYKFSPLIHIFLEY